MPAVAVAAVAALHRLRRSTCRLRSSRLALLQVLRVRLPHGHLRHLRGLLLLRVVPDLAVPVPLQSLVLRRPNPSLEVVTLGMIWIRSSTLLPTIGRSRTFWSEMGAPIDDADSAASLYHCDGRSCDFQSDTLRR